MRYRELTDMSTITNIGKSDEAEVKTELSANPEMISGSPEDAKEPLGPASTSTFL